MRVKMRIQNLGLCLCLLVLGCSGTDGRTKATTTNGHESAGKRLVDVERPKTASETEENEVLELPECLSKILSDEESFKEDFELKIECESFTKHKTGESSAELLETVESEIASLKAHQEDLNDKISKVPKGKDEEKNKEKLNKELNLTIKILSEYEEVQEGLTEELNEQEKKEKVSSLHLKYIEKIFENLSKEGLSFALVEGEMQILLNLGGETEENKQKSKLEEINKGLKEFMDAFEDLLSEGLDISKDLNAKNELSKIISSSLEKVLKDFSADSLESLLSLIDFVTYPLCEEDESFCEEEVVQAEEEIEETAEEAVEEMAEKVVEEAEVD